MLLENNPYPQDIRVRSEAESLVAAGHRVEVVAPRADGQLAYERIRGVEVRRYRPYAADGRSMWGILLEYAVAVVALNAGALRALARGATVLHLHNPPDILFTAAVLFRLAGRRVVFDHHDLGPELVAVRFRSRWLVRLATWSERLTFALANHVLAANESHAQIARGRGGKQAREVTVVRNGPPSSWTRLPLRARDGKLNAVRLVYVGAIAAQDGVDALAEVLARLREHEPPLGAHLTVIGDGNARDSLEAALARWRTADAVTITGWVAPERVPELIQEADVCVDPAPRSELNDRSTMVKVAEYLALGKPVVAYDLLETERTAGGAAVLVPAGDTRAFAAAIAALAEDPAVRLDLAARARARAQALTWECSQEALVSAYASFGGTGTPRLR